MVLGLLLEGLRTFLMTYKEIIYTYIFRLKLKTVKRCSDTAHTGNRALVGLKGTVVALMRKHYIFKRKQSGACSVLKTKQKQPALSYSQS